MSAAPTRSAGLDREQIATSLVGRKVVYSGSAGSFHGQTFVVIAAYDDQVTLAVGVGTRPVLSFVKLSSITPQEES